MGGLSSKKLGLMTARDPVLSQVLRCIRMGWVQNPADVLRPYSTRQTELYELNDVIMWGNRVVIPPKARHTVLTELHACHFGVVKMKSVARSSVWWPGIDRDIEQLASGCEICQLHRPDPPKEELHPWQWPHRPWSRLHVDFAGPMRGKYYLVVVDAFSKWIEVEEMTSITAQATVSRLTVIFSRFGLPDILVSDNGPTFTSEEFQAFLTRNGIVHRTTAPYMPSSNGLAERAVRELKIRLEKMTTGNVSDRISKWLFFYRTTRHATTGETPSRLLLGYQPVTRLDRLKPSLESNVRAKQFSQVEQHKRRHTAPRSTLSAGDEVLARYYRQGKAFWRHACVVRCYHPMFDVRFESGDVCKRHINQLRSRRSQASSGGVEASSGAALLSRTDGAEDGAALSSQTTSLSPSRCRRSGGSSSRPPDSLRLLPVTCSGPLGGGRYAASPDAAGASLEGAAGASLGGTDGPEPGSDVPDLGHSPSQEGRRAASPVRAAGDVASDANERRYPVRERRRPDRLGY